MLTSYVTITSRSEFSRNKTGFGYMVYDIARSVGKLVDVEVMASDVRYDEFEKDRIKFVGVSYWKILRNTFRCLNVGFLASLILKYHIPYKTAIRLIYYWWLSGYVSSLITERRYDIVHIHGCGFYTEMWMRVCRRAGQRFVVTLHGLNSFSDTVRLDASSKQYERDFLRRVVEGELPITVISTGMRRLIEKTFNVAKCPNITVVCNSFSFSSDKVARR